MRTIFSISLICGAAILSGGVAEAQEKNLGSGNYPEPNLYKGVQTKIKIQQPNFRKGNEDAGEQGYSAYPAAPEVMEEIIPPPPIPATEQEVEVAPVKSAPPKPAIVEQISPVKVRKQTYSTPPAPKPDIPLEAPPIGRYEPPAYPAPVATPVAPMAYNPSAPGRPAYPPGNYQPKPQPQPERYPATRPDRIPEPRVQARPVPPVPQPKVDHDIDCPFHRNGLDGPDSSIVMLREEANELARQGIQFRFGRSHPAFGGLDSAGAVQYLLNEVGVPGVPRTMVDQSSWVRVNNLLHEFYGRPAIAELTDNLVPGNLIFWGDHRRLTHVMIYLGYDKVRRQHLAFGTRGGTEVGINGNEVDIFGLKLERERIVGTGPVPGLIY